MKATTVAGSKVPVSYNFYQAACVPVFSGNISYLCIVFVLGFCVCFVVYLITYIIIFIARKKKLEKPKHDDENPDKNKTPCVLSLVLTKSTIKYGSHRNKIRQANIK
jgi:heme/copper-type cytochrome/quinol oxidase subunit 3